MQILGIDYGTKRVGIALSDDGESMAMPLDVLTNDKDLMNNIKKICNERDIESIVLGESKDLEGKDNEVMKDILKFKSAIEEELKMNVYLEPEFMTSVGALHMQEDTKKLDASSAALILQSFLDRKNNINNN